MKVDVSIKPMRAREFPTTLNINYYKSLKYVLRITVPLSFKYEDLNFKICCDIPSKNIEIRNDMIADFFRILNNENTVTKYYKISFDLLSFHNSKSDIFIQIFYNERKIFESTRFKVYARVPSKNEKKIIGNKRDVSTQTPIMNLIKVF